MVHNTDPSDEQLIQWFYQTRTNCSWIPISCGSTGINQCGSPPKVATKLIHPTRKTRHELKGRLTEKLVISTT